MGILIVAGVVAILCIAAMGGLVLVKVLKKGGLFDIIFLGGLGALFLGTLVMLFGGKTAAIIGSVFSLLGWPALAVGFIVPRFGLLREILAAKPAPAQPQAAQQAPAAQESAPEASPPSEDPTKSEGEAKSE